MANIEKGPGGFNSSGSENKIEEPHYYFNDPPSLVEAKQELEELENKFEATMEHFDAVQQDILSGKLSQEEMGRLIEQRRQYGAEIGQLFLQIDSLKRKLKALEEQSEKYLKQITDFDNPNLPKAA